MRLSHNYLLKVAFFGKDKLWRGREVATRRSHPVSLQIDGISDVGTPKPQQLLSVPTLADTKEFHLKFVTEQVRLLRFRV